MVYDEDNIFTHLLVMCFPFWQRLDVLSRCFYLDSPQNARNNGMTVKSKREADIEAKYVATQPFVLKRCSEKPFSFTSLSQLITENGGRVVDLNEPKLTHIVIDKRDDSRRLELMKRTSKYDVLSVMRKLLGAHVYI